MVLLGGVFLDYWLYAKNHGIIYDPFDHHAISHEELVLCGKSQGIDIRPESEGGDILPGDILLIRSGNRKKLMILAPQNNEKLLH
jgi:hypothetical protein